MKQRVTFQKVSRITIEFDAGEKLAKEQLEFWANKGHFGSSPLDAEVINPMLVSYHERGQWVAIAEHEPEAPRPRGRPRRARP